MQNYFLPLEKSFGLFIDSGLRKICGIKLGDLFSKIAS